LENNITGGGAYKVFGKFEQKNIFIKIIIQMENLTNKNFLWEIKKIIINCKISKKYVWEFLHRVFRLIGNFIFTEVSY